MGWNFGGVLAEGTLFDFSICDKRRARVSLRLTRRRGGFGVFGWGRGSLRCGLRRFREASF